MAPAAATVYATPVEDYHEYEDKDCPNCEDGNLIHCRGSKTWACDYCGYFEQD